MRPKYDDLMQHDWISKTGEECTAEELGTFIGEILDAFAARRAEVLPTGVADGPNLK